jgi:hypothetical protein
MELLAAAGRVAVEMQERPALRRLYRTAAQLPEAALEELITAAEERLKWQQVPKAPGEQGRDPIQHS